MTDKPFKAGDIVMVKVPKGLARQKGLARHRLVVELTYDRGKMQHCLCSYVDEPWSPVLLRCDFLERVK